MKRKNKPSKTSRERQPFESLPTVKDPFEYIESLKEEMGNGLTGVFAGDGVPAVHGDGTLGIALQRMAAHLEPDTTDIVEYDNLLAKCSTGWNAAITRQTGGKFGPDFLEQIEEEGVIEELEEVISLKLDWYPLDLRLITKVEARQVEGEPPGTFLVAVGYLPAPPRVLASLKRC